MKFDVMKRQTGKVQFTAEIDCAQHASMSVKLGLAVPWAIKAGADLAGANLAGAYLAEADLAGAYLAGANLAGANLAGADLAGAYLAEADLAGANLAGANLAEADLAEANLAEANLAEANLAGANLAEANLAGAYLAGAYLAGANLAGAYLAGAYLAEADLAGANEVLQIEEKDIPIIPNIDDAILAAIEAGGVLDMSSWHGPNNEWCGTTHCRAGWVVHLAGKPGKALQDRVGVQMAATLIYHASRRGQPSPWFFAPQNQALADIHKCAAEQNPARAN